jgi:hypothetical protein
MQIQFLDTDGNLLDSDLMESYDHLPVLVNFNKTSRNRVGSQSYIINTCSWLAEIGLYAFFPDCWETLDRYHSTYGSYSIHEAFNSAIQNHRFRSRLESGIPLCEWIETALGFYHNLDGNRSKIMGFMIKDQMVMDPYGNWSRFGTMAGLPNIRIQFV